MTFIPFDEGKKKKKKQIERPSMVPLFRGTEMYKLLSGKGMATRRLVQNMLTGSNLVESDGAANERNQKILQDAMQAVGDVFALDVMLKVIPAGLDRALLDIAPVKKNTLQLFFSDRASKFKDQIIDILGTIADVGNEVNEPGMFAVTVTPKEDYEIGSYSKEVSEDLPT